MTNLGEITTSLNDLSRPSRAIYWSDFLISCLLGWGAFSAALFLSGLTFWTLSFCAALALYRAVSFIHELSHRSRKELPAFSSAWNCLIGYPLLLPSAFYVPIHSSHHSIKHYATENDPRYLPFARQAKPWLFVPFLILPLAPLLLVFRFLLIFPLSLCYSPLRSLVLRRLSAFDFNPAFIRAEMTTREASEAKLQELICSGLGGGEGCN